MEKQAQRVKAQPWRPIAGYYLLYQKGTITQSVSRIDSNCLDLAGFALLESWNQI